MTGHDTQMYLWNHEQSVRSFPTVYTFSSVKAVCPKPNPGAWGGSRALIGWNATIRRGKLSDLGSGRYYDCTAGNARVPTVHIHSQVSFSGSLMQTGRHDDYLYLDRLYIYAG